MNILTKVWFLSNIYLLCMYSKKNMSLKSDRVAPPLTDLMTLTKSYSLAFDFPIYKMGGLIPTS